MSAVDALARALIERSPASAARTLERFDAGAVAEILGELPPEPAAAVVRVLSMAAARAALQAAPPATAAAILGRLPAPRAAALLRGVAIDRRPGMLGGLAAEPRAAIDRALAHRPGTVAALMEPASGLAAGLDAAAALDRVRDLGAAAGATVQVTVQVIDAQGRLVGLAPVAALVTAAATARLGDLARPEAAPLHEEDEAALLIDHPGWRTADVLPVVGRGGELVGIVRYRSVEELLVDRPAEAAGGVGLPVSLAELFWLGLAGITDGLARVVTAQRDDRPAPPPGAAR